jgi:ABC-type molybdenum transport system ATPase subunit/photorepair protein PhrA
MIRVAWKGLVARPVRTALTTLAIVIGVAFVTAAYTLTDTMSGAADTLTHAAYDGTDAVVVTTTAFRGSQTADIRAQAPTISADALTKIRRAPGVALAVGDITDTAQVIGANGKPVGTGPYFGVGFDARTPGAERRDHKPAQLSGGQQQRVAVARALICTPTVLFADEPTGNLDSAAGAGVLELLRNASDHDGQTTVMVTHDARAAATADRVLFLADGRVVADLEGPTEERILSAMKDAARA